jgi:pyridoxal phosphate enzyme (YggS family)
VLARVASACLASGRNVSDVELVAITKNHPAELVAELVDLGQLQFGENRDQEAAPKATLLTELRPQANPTWHFVGQLQSNKVKSVLRYARVIHSIDRASLVGELAKQLPKFEGTYSGFIELNLTSDPGRGGVLPENLPQLAESVLALENFELLGVMAVAGLDQDPRSEFEKVLSASQALQGLSPQANQLSMGMSEDFEVAIAMGATHIRVGSAITGPRPTNA